MTWQQCLSSSDAAAWLCEALQTQLHYAAPLPVQSAVVPTVCRALRSGLALDVSLTAPTGSGKTLCYVLPMLSMIAAAKRGNDDTQLRALVLVPTRALGQQVCREVRRLTRHTSIAVVSLCDEQQGVRSEAQQLVRRVRVHGGCGSGSDVAGVDSDAIDGDAIDNHDGDGDDEVADVSYAGTATAAPSLDSTATYYTYSRTDVLIATPQRLLRHLDTTAGLRLAALRLLVIDEADQVLSGSFTSAVVKVVERAEQEVRTLLRHEARLANSITQRCLQTTTTTTAAATMTTMVPVLHKMLCSATLSARITRISEVRLRNCRHFTLDSAGVDVADTTMTPGHADGDKGSDDEEEETDTAAVGSATASAPRQQQQQHAHKTTTTMSMPTVRTSFALPPNLHEHIVFVEDSYRHAVLLKLVRTLLARLAARAQRRRRVRHSNNNNDDDDDNDDDHEDDGEKSNEDNNSNATAAAAATSSSSSCDDYPCVDADDAGSRVLVFCSSADEARVTGHFLYAAGVHDVVEFTTAATPSERRRALLQRSATCVVATDALMRGIDMADVGHVILYHAPESMAQYVHRAGRTARALRSGHLHLLLSKRGASGTLADGEVAAYRALSAAVTRSRPPHYERHFFYFAHAPDKASKANDEDTTTAATTATTDAAHGMVVGSKRSRAVHDTHAQTTNAEAAAAAAATAADDNVDEAKRSAEWWLAEAERALARSQHHLRVQWSSAHEYSSHVKAADVQSARQQQQQQQQPQQTSRLRHVS